MIRAHQWQQLKSILADAIEKESTKTRAEFVRRSCGHDSDLLEAAEYLLAQPDIFRCEGIDELEACANSTAISPISEPSRADRRIGAYVIRHWIAEGGMGAVYLAERADGCFEKQVAIKLLAAGPRNKDALRRFQSERQALARLDHPHISRLVDAGTTDDDVPYFIMEYVDGIPVTSFAEEQRLSLIKRLELFLKIASAVQCAHDHGIIHRDLKPSNILVNRDSEPKLLDFGIAKLFAGLSDPQLPTVSGKERLSPLFASPEQVKGEAVTISSDVYSLGVVLYGLVTDSLPFRFNSDTPSSAEILAAICDQQPIRPSRVSGNRKQRRQLRGDLDAILLRAIQKEPFARYSCVAEFAEDIGRHLDGRPVLARSHQVIYRFARLVFRNRLSRILWAIASVALVGLIAVFFSGSDLTRRTTPPAEGISSDAIAERLFVQAWELAMTGSEPNSKESLIKAVPLLEDAIARDPHLVRAYNLLAIVHLDLYWQGFDHTPERRDLALAAIKKGARWNPNSGEINIARANFAYHGFRDYTRALNELEIARSKLPNNATVYSFIASIDRRQGQWGDALRNFEKAVQLDPGSFRFEEEQAFTYETLRNYAAASRAYERALSIVPQNYFVRTQLARIPFLERGDIQPLKSEISAILKEKPTAAKDIANTLIDCALIDRDPVLADQALAVMRPEGLIDTYADSRSSRDWFAGLLARTLGNANKARASFLLARATEQKLLNGQSDDAHAWSRLGLIDAALGNKTDAIREGTHGCELLPVSRDALDGTVLITNLAMIYAWTGEKDLALQRLKAVTDIPAQISYGELKLSPKWDELRDDPRFQRIVHSLAPR